MNARRGRLIAAARVGPSIKGCTLYLVTRDPEGKIWGGPPCLRCTMHVIQAGIIEIVTLPIRDVPSRWHAELEEARDMLDEAGVLHREVKHG